MQQESNTNLIFVLGLIFSQALEKEWEWKLEKLGSVTFSSEYKMQQRKEFSFLSLNFPSKHKHNQEH